MGRAAWQNDVVETLRKYYTQRLVTLAVALAAGAVLATEVVLPWLTRTLAPDNFLIDVAGFLTSRPAFVGVMLLGELGIRKTLWRLERPQLDFSGQWEGETTYTKVRLGKVADHAPFASRHLVLIEQDALSAKLAPAPGTDFVNWGSLAFEIVDKDTVRYAYTVNYSDSTRFPDRAIGYEEMSVTRRDRRKRPNELTGFFAHCAQGQEPVYSGTVVFRRKTAKAPARPEAR